ncbi:hypothetical protein HNP02_007107 [Mycobacterium sp. AZCC_0083]|nr:hypothetical protein [Mycobacterium sp. AZCC_0083]
MIYDPNFWWGVGLTTLVIVGAYFGVNVLDELL